MGNESNSNSNIDTSPHSMESDGEDNSPDRKNSTMEAEQAKPKRKYTKRKQSAEPSGVGHSVSLQKSTTGGGSTVQQSRKKRERNDRHKQELASKLGLVSEELPRSKPRKTRARREPDSNSDDDDVSSEEEENGIECENDFDSIIGGMLPFLAARTNPVDIILNRITSAFVGYPVVAHLSRTSPSTQKLIIEIEI